MRASAIWSSAAQFLLAFQPALLFQSILGRKRFPRVGYRALQSQASASQGRFWPGSRRIRHCDTETQSCQITGFVVRESVRHRRNRAPVFIRLPPLSLQVHSQIASLHSQIICKLTMAIGASLAPLTIMSRVLGSMLINESGIEASGRRM